MTDNEIYKKSKVIVGIIILLLLLSGESGASTSDNMENAYLHLYEQMDLYQTGSTPRLIRSYVGTPGQTNDYMSWVYDNDLALLAMLKRGTSEDISRAKILADSLIWVQNHDQDFNDGRIRDGYWATSINDPSGKNSSIKSLGSGTGNMAWTIIALLSSYETAGNITYLDGAKRLGDWINYSYDIRGAGGYTGGYEDRNFDWKLEKIEWKSTEHNIDAYVAFSRLYSLTGNKTWEERAQHAKNFVEAMWNETEGHFWTGTLNDGVTINKQSIPLDVNTWGLMALGEKYKRGIGWAENHSFVEADGFKGYDFNDDRDGIWFEGTAHMVIAYQILGDEEKADLYLGELRRAQTTAQNANGKGIVAASHDGVSTGFGWVYNAQPHIGATAWYIFAENMYNPYWNVRSSSLTPETLAKDTWNYFKTFNENHLPLNWYRMDMNMSGRYFNPAEAGFYALSPVLAYDMGLDCDGDGTFEPGNEYLQEDDWDCSINRTSNTLNRIEALFTYQQSAHDIWELGDNEAPPDYNQTAYDEFDQTKPFNSHYHISEPVSDFPKELNDGDLAQIFIHFNLTGEEAENEQILFLDTLNATHDNVPYFNLRIKIGQSVNDMSDLGEYKFGSGGNYPEYPEERYIAIDEKYLEPGENVLLLENANLPQSGHWIYWDSLRLGKLRKAYYQWYNTNGYVGSGQNDKLVPSIDNAWLAASLITIREYARANGENALSNQSDNILKGIDFTMWYNYTDHRFFWGDINNPKKGAVADYYSNENRIINFLARALGQINQSEFQASLKALDQPIGSYGNITVEKVNWGGVYFTYTSPALFIREKDTSYAKTLENATWAQIKYAEDKGYPCWGISDATSPINPDDYVGTGAPPAAGGYHDAGFLTPYASALALVNKNPELLDRAIANLNCLKNLDGLYDSRYGFKDSINVTDNLASTKFLTLDQEWILLSLANYRNNTIWKYFYMDNGVRKAHEEMYGAAAWTVCSSGCNYTKIQDAIDNASAGDEIHVDSGTYIENVDVNKILTIKSKNGALSTIVRAKNEDNPIFTVNSDYVNISGFTIGGENSDSEGIHLKASNSIISNNIINSHHEGGIMFWESSHNTLRGNLMIDSGIWIFGWELHHFIHEIYENNTINGKPVYYRKDITGEKIPEGAGQIILVNCKDILVENQNIDHSGTGIQVAFSSNITIRNNKISENDDGIRISFSNNNNLLNNYISYNSAYGIISEYSSNNTLTGNVMVNNGLWILGWSLNDYIHEIDESNIVNGKPVYYWKNVDGGRIPDEAGTVFIINSKNVTLENQSFIESDVGAEVAFSSNITIRNNYCMDNIYGIELWKSNNNVVYNNTCSGNWAGLYVFYSNNNSIYENNLISNSMGIYFHSSNYNNIFLNNFENNINILSSISTNIWNSKSKIYYKYNNSNYIDYLGNYWIDYTGSDNDGNGIGDAPYIINLDRDNFSLMEPFDNYSISTASTPLPFPGVEKSPTDPDGDGLYEDINGNGRKDFNDIVIFFNYLEWVASNQPISNFDFNGNGRIDFNDIVKLFEEL